MIDKIEDIIDEAEWSRLDEDISRTGEVTRIGSFDFKCTCFACPEQYDVFRAGEYVAYVRERDGHLTVHPVTEDAINWKNIIYEEYEDGKGDIFEKREEKLTHIAKEIEQFYIK